MMANIIDWFQNWNTFSKFQVLIALLVTIYFAIVVARALNSLKRRSRSYKKIWDSAFYEASVPAASWIILLIGLTWSIDITSDYLDTTVFSWTSTVRKSGLIALITWFLIRFFTIAEKNFLNQSHDEHVFDETTLKVSARLLRISTLIIASLVFLQSFGYSISGVLAFGGIGGLAVGFASKDLLANFFGGLMIYLDRPFNVGDWIRSPDQDIEGIVEDIGWRLTCIRRFDKRPLYVPNATFTHISVENPSRMSHRRINETLGIRYDDVSKMEFIIDDVKKMLKDHSDIDSNQIMIVNFDAFASSSLDFFIYTFTKTTDWVEYHKVKQDVLLKIERIISNHGAEIAFPTSTLHIKSNIENEH